MRNLYLFLTTLLLSITLNAQTDQGVVFMDVGGDLLNFTSMTLQDIDPVNPYDEWKSSTVGISTKIGYFIADGLVGGILLDISSTKTEYEQSSNGYYSYMYKNETKSTSTGFGPFLRYYFDDSGVFAEASYAFGSTKIEEEESGNGYSYDDEDEMTRTAWSIGAGYAIYVSDMISISPSISYGGYKEVEKDGASTTTSTGPPNYNYITIEEDEETTVSGISFKIGINLYLE